MKLLKITILSLFITVLAVSVNAQSDGSFYLRDDDYSGYTYQYYIGVWDNDISTWVTGTWEGPYSADVNDYNDFTTSIQVTPDIGYGRWRIVIYVDKKLGSSIVDTKSGYSVLLTSDQYIDGGVTVSQINF